MRKNVISHSVVSPVSTAKSIASSVVPKSLSGEDMLKFGKIIKLVEKKILNVGVEEFDIESKEWIVLGPVSFLTEITPFGKVVLVMHLRLQVIILNLEMQPT